MQNVFLVITLSISLKFMVKDEHYRGNDGSHPTLENPPDSKEKETGFEEEEETEPDRSSPRQRHQRSGRPEKRIIEESANDPYCE